MKGTSTNINNSIAFASQHAIDALRQIEVTKGKDRAKLLEKMLRLETAHFTSGQYKHTGSAGMEDGKWPNLPQGSYSTIKMNDNHLTGAAKLRTFIKWNSVYSFLLYLSDYIDRHSGNFARWNSTNETKQASYRKEVNSIKNKTII
ncbi:MAG: hypothetical protein V4613_03605 [Bacteroidota bacterium]